MIWCLDRESSMKHIWIVTVIIAITLIGVSGCTMKNINKKQDVEKENASTIISSMERFIKKKYEDIDYKFVAFRAADGFFYPYDELTLSTVVDDIEYEFVVQRRKTDDGYAFEDNYYGVIIKDEYEAYISKYVSEYFDEFFIDATTYYPHYPNSLDSDSDIEDLLKLKDEIGGIVVIIVANETFSSVDEFENAAENFCDKYGNIGLKAVWRIVYVDNETYASVDKSNYNEKHILEDNRITEYKR